MSSRARLSNLANNALNEHAQVHADLVQMERTLAALEPTDPDPQVFQRITNQLQALYDGLEQHFAAEERTRLFSRLLRLLPDAAQEIAQLEAEHHDILLALSEARAGARHCTPTQAEEFRGGVEEVLETLYAHEVVEDQLMMRAFSLEERTVG